MHGGAIRLVAGAVFCRPGSLTPIVPLRLRSLRMWLQSSSLLAVLAGYMLLLAAGAALSGLERQQAHRQLVQLMAAKLVASTSATSPVVLEPYRLLGLSASLAPPAAPIEAHVLQQGPQTWLESRTPVQIAGPKLATLIVRQNVTASIQREHTLMLLLLAAAGLASLFTSALLRPVLQQGLVSPIEALCHQLERISQHSFGTVELEVGAQPQELQPIAQAFNALQARLALVWNRERTFTDGLAHELRTPITLMSGQAQSLLRQPLPAELRQPLTAIGLEAERMGQLVSAMLDLARQDAGRLQLRCQPVAPEWLMLEAFDRLRPLAADRLRLAPAEPDPLPEVHADPERLLQCLAALVDNALAYSQGVIEIALSHRHQQVIWHVRDRGPGVADGEQALIFERFVRGAAAAGGRQRGSGLGLAVVRLLMEAMGGGVGVANRSDGGADFQLWLSCLSPAPPRDGG